VCVNVYAKAATIIIMTITLQAAIIVHVYVTAMAAEITNVCVDVKTTVSVFGHQIIVRTVILGCISMIC